MCQIGVAPLNEELNGVEDRMGTRLDIACRHAVVAHLQEWPEIVDRSRRLRAHEGFIATRSSLVSSLQAQLLGASEQRVAHQGRHADRVRARLKFDQ